MLSQPIWIGIVIVAFLVGLGSTYLIFHTGGSDVNADFSMMETPQHAQEMAVMMKMNHDFTMEMMSVMIEDPALQLQMIGHMAENPEAMKQIMNLMDKKNTRARNDDTSRKDDADDERSRDAKNDYDHYARF